VGDFLPSFYPASCPFLCWLPPISAFLVRKCCAIVYFFFISPAYHHVLGNPAFLSLERTTTEVEDFRFLFFLVLLLFFLACERRRLFLALWEKASSLAGYFLFIYLFSFCTCIQCMCVSLGGGGGNFSSRFFPMGGCIYKKTTYIDFYLLSRLLIHAPS